MSDSRRNSDLDHEPRRGWGVMGLGGALLLSLCGACFAGTGAEGLPCENDDDCGLSLKCEQSGCCGGPCLDDSTTSPTTSTTETTSTSTTETTTSSTTETTTSSTTDPSGSTGPVGECGDGEVQEALGEECDLGMMGNRDPFGGCSERCRRPAFLFTSNNSGVDNIPMANLWGTGFHDDSLGAIGDWFQDNDGSWHSGAHPNPMLGVYGIKLVPSLPFRIDAAQGERAVLHIDHELDFATCEPVPEVQEFDGARVMFGFVPPDAAMPRLGAPEPTMGQNSGNISMLEMEPGCDMAPWVDGFNAFVLDGPGPEGPFVLPPEVLNEMVTLQLQIAYTCGDCGGEDGDEWIVNAVSVIVEPSP